MSTFPFNGPRRGVRLDPSATLSAGNPPVTAKVHRVEIWPRREDVRAQALATKVRREHHAEISARTAKVYLIQGDLDDQSLLRVASSLLADPVTETFRFGSEPAAKGASIIEVHPLPGVMDPAAQSVREAITSLLGSGVDVVTGVRYDIAGVDASKAKDLVARTVANPVVHEIHEGVHTPDHLPRGSAYTLQKRVVRIRELTPDELTSLSRRAHLFLSVEEMRAVQAHYQTLGRDPSDIELETLAQTWSEHCVHKTLKSKVVYRETQATKGGDSGAAGLSGAGGAPKPAQNPPKPPRIDVSFAFSPKGKALPLREERPAPAAESESPTAGSAGGGTIDFAGRPGHIVGADGTVTIDNLLKNTIAAATFELIEDGCDWALSVFKDNSGVVAFDDTNAVCIKVETHNRPSAIEPYGGAATGIGGCIRDIIGTGLGARPIASTDVFCVAEPEHWRTGADDKNASKDAKALPPGVLHSRRILSDVVAGVRDYGNRMGIPTVNGAVFFDDRYVGNPLVFCGCVGLIPNDRIHGKTRAGDRIIALGGRTGRDGIHGATFSSAELESSASTEFAHAVQIGNAIEEKRVLEAIMRARDAAGGPLYTAMTDCGAGGFSSAVGEMGKDVGAVVHLDRAPTKYAGLSYTEIWISEAQERMVLAVPPGNVAAIKAICDEEGVELADLGEFGAPDKQLVLNFMGEEVGRMSMDFLHDGIPSPTRVASWTPSDGAGATARTGKAPGVSKALHALLAHPNIASKHWIIRQYDHEVRGGTITKPLVGPGGRGPSDAAVIEPTPREGTPLNQRRAIALGCGVSPWTGDEALGGDPYHMALNAIDECVRNLVCSGADPRRIAILDNFCWPSCDRPENMGALVRACEGCYDGAKAYRTPFVSGKDSLNNQLRYDDNGTQRVIEIPRTLLITGLGHVGSLARCVTMDAKQPGNLLMLIGPGSRGMGGSHYQRMFGLAGEREALNASVPTVDLEAGPRVARAVAQCIADGLVRAAHDVSDGGVLACIAEMLIATTGARRGGEAPANLYASTLAQLMSGGTNVPALGAELTMWDDLLEAEELAFSEGPSRYVVEVRAEDVSKVRTVLTDNAGASGIRASVLGTLNGDGRLVWERGDVNDSVDELADIWRTPLDW